MGIDGEYTECRFAQSNMSFNLIYHLAVVVHVWGAISSRVVIGSLSLQRERNHRHS